MPANPPSNELPPGFPSDAELLGGYQAAETPDAQPPQQRLGTFAPSPIAELDVSRSIISGLQSTIALLEKSNSQLQQSLESTHKRLDETIEKKWFWPRTLFIGVTAILALFFGVNLYTQYVNLSGINDVAERLNSELETSRGKRVTAELQANALRQDHDRLKEQFDAAAKNQATSLATSLSVHASAHRIISLVSLGRMHLLEREDPGRGLYYSEQAVTAMESARKVAGEDKALLDVVNRLAGMVWHLHADCAWQMGDKTRVETAAASLRELGGCPWNEGSNPEPCEAHEGFYYYGIVQLAKGSSLRSEEHRGLRHSDILAAIESLKQATGSKADAPLAGLFLSAAYFDVHEFVASIDVIDHHFGAELKKTDEERRRLGAQARAHIEIANAWRLMSEWALKRRTKIADAVNCSIDTGAVSREDGKLLEAMLIAAIENRQKMIGDKRRANALGLVCANAIASLRRANGAESCAATCSTAGCRVGEVRLWEKVPFELIEEFGLERLYEHVPELSRDKSLGSRRGDKVLMSWVEPKEVDSVAHVKLPDGTVKEETFKIEILEPNSEEYDVAAIDIPERRYVKVEDAMNGGVPGPVPAIENAPDAPAEPNASVPPEPKA